MREWLKISQHEHTGRLRPHEHTSYLPLIILVLVVGVALLGFSVKVMADDPPPQYGSVGLSGTVPKPPPTSAATILVPTNQHRFSTSPITISGTCPAKTMIEIYKNDIFAGSGPCSDTGTFSFSIDLLYGHNVLTARVYDALNQAGPDSAPVNVFYDAVAPQAGALSSLDFSGSQLLLNTDAIYRGTFPKQLLNIPISIIGGTPPYAVNVEWGDSGNKVIPRNDTLTFNAGHVYQKPGIYQITIQATDSQQRVAFLSVASIINGQPGILSSAAPSKKAPLNKLLVLWPFYASALTMVVSFWLGEQREKHVLSPITA